MRASQSKPGFAALTAWSEVNGFQFPPVGDPGRGDDRLSIGEDGSEVPLDRLGQSFEILERNTFRHRVQPLRVKPCPGFTG
jgi:hypothetical protein